MLHILIITSVSNDKVLQKKLNNIKHCRLNSFHINFQAHFLCIYSVRNFLLYKLREVNERTDN